MEDVKVIQEFLLLRPSGYGYGYGYGYGLGDDGDGSGYGSGHGSLSDDGSGSGYGSGYDGDDGDGSGYGSGHDGDDGDGYGSGHGLKEYNGETVWYVDGVPTLIHHVRGNHAIGHVINGDLTTTPCYIARNGNYFAHGETLKKAVEDAEAKALEEMPQEERISRFKDKFPTLKHTATCEEFSKWHHVLTGSCTMGREQFVKERGLDKQKEYTVAYFLDITAGSYGDYVIRQLRESYK